MPSPDRADGGGKGGKRAKEELSLLERYVLSAPWANEVGGVEARRARGEKYLFTFRSNVMYNARGDPNPCVYGDALDIVPNDYVKVVAVIDDYWWVGRLVGGSSICKYVPSPKCFLQKHTASKRARRDSVRGDQGEEDASSGLHEHSSVLGMFDFRKKRNPDRSKGVLYTRYPVRTLPVYDLAPDVRPLIIVGPSAPGYEVTDKMQYALISYLLKSFSQHCVKVIVDEEVAPGLRMVKTKSVGSGGGLHLTSEKMNEIFLIGSSGKVPILITMRQNIDALRHSPLMPIIAQIRIPSTKVLTKLIKTRPDRSGLQMQANYTEKLNTMNHNNFDVILVHSKLEESCYELAAYVDAYLQDINMDPVIDPKVWHAVNQDIAGEARTDFAEPVPMVSIGGTASAAAAADAPVQAAPAPMGI